MFEDINEYILKSRDERRAHLLLTSECIEIGGNSYQARLLLAHARMTTVPTHKEIHVCHACNNGKCSNVLHLYWGTPKDNYLDRVEAGTAFPKWQRTEAHLDAQRKSGENLGRLHGGSNRLSPEDLCRIKEVLDSIPKTWGWISKASKILGVSHTQVKRYLKMVDPAGLEPASSHL